MIRNLLFSGSFLLVAGACAANKAEDISLFSSNGLVTTKYASALPSLVTKDDLLYVGLEPYLGRIKRPLLLNSAGEKLLLKDGKGIVHKSSTITIEWRKVPLLSPQKIVRKIAGPFSSFESAEQFAKQLEKIGIQSNIAHPKDWEVWVEGEMETPLGMDFVQRIQIIDYAIKPVLKGRNLELLLEGPISINAPDGLVWKTGIYKGPFLLIADAYGSWTLVEKVTLQQYLNGVVPHEIGASSPPNALAVQAVLARTWALANMHRFKIDGYHLCSDVQCQVYKDPNKSNENIKQAIEKTLGQFLAWKGKPIHAVYHATNGGVMASANEAWAMDPLSYVRPKLDGSPSWTNRFNLPLISNSSVRSILASKDGANGSYHHLFRWKRIFTVEKLKKALYQAPLDFESPKTIKVLQRGSSGRVLSLAILGSNAQTLKILRLDNIRRTLRDLPSTLFVIDQLEEGVWQFSGGGFGHGVGLSQAGAIDLALKGWKPTQILMHYYPGTDYETLP